MQFYSLFGEAGGAARMVCAPGRANVIGEHTDYQEGYVTPFALEERCYLVYRPSLETSVVRAYAADLESWATVDLAEMAAKRRLESAWGSRAEDFEEQWCRFVAGPMEWLRTEALEGNEGYRGCEVLVTSTVPLGGGVSSSSALSVASAAAARDVYRDLAWKKGKSMLMAACEAEWHYSGVRGGIMDQFASLYGKKGEALVLDCRSRKVKEVVKFPEDEVRFLIINTNVKHSLADSPYTKRRESCERVALEAARQFPDLKITHLRDLSDLGKEKGLDILKQLNVNPEDLQRATHGVLENCRVLEAIEAAKAKDWNKFGKYMDEAHFSLANLYEVSCPELDAACLAARESPFCLGARLMGGGFGGCAIALCTDTTEVENHVAPRYKDLTNGKEATIFQATPGPGAQLLNQSEWLSVFDFPFFHSNPGLDSDSEPTL